LGPAMATISLALVGRDAIGERLGQRILCLGWHRPAEALANDLGAGDSVKFLGTITDAALDAAYARATVFALPSSKEGFRSRASWAPGDLQLQRCAEGNRRGWGGRLCGRSRGYFNARTG
jgi:hypothetical protein